MLIENMPRKHQELALHMVHMWEIELEILHGERFDHVNHWSIPTNRGGIALAQLTL